MTELALSTLRRETGKSTSMKTLKEEEKWSGRVNAKT